MSLMLIAYAGYAPSITTAYAADGDGDQGAESEQIPGVAIPASPVVSEQPSAPEGDEAGPAVQFPLWERAAEEWELPEEMRLENLKRFGEDLFAQSGGPEPRTANMPVSPQYIVGPGDELAVRVWSEGIEHLNRRVIVAAEGTVYLPLLGEIAVAATPLGGVRDTIAQSLSQFYVDAQTSVTVASTRVIAVYVTGDVTKPGRYGLDGTATALTALYMAGGPTPAGSLRNIRLLRMQQEPGEIDLYPYLLAGEPLDEPLLESGDTVFVGPVGSEVGVAGAVRRPGRYELVDPTTCLEAIKMAGGLIPEGSGTGVRVWRIADHQQQVVINVDLGQSAEIGGRWGGGFLLEPGDVVVVAPVDRMPGNAARISGAVRRPGIYQVEEGMTVGALIGRAGGLDEGAYLGYGRIRRLDEQRQHQYESFSVQDALDEGTDSIALRPYDTVHVYYRREITPITHVEVRGPVQQPGKYEWVADMRIRDLVMQSGGLTDEAYLKQARILRLRLGQGRSVLKVKLQEALADDPGSNMRLQPGDLLELVTRAAAGPPHTVHIAGFVQRPSSYERFQGMRVSDLILAAGSLTPGASESIEYAQGRQTGPPRVHQLALDAGRDGEIAVQPDLVLSDDDQVTVLGLGDFRQQPPVVRVDGQVQAPGAYILRGGTEESETVYDLLQRAGPLLENANPDGIILYRPTEQAMTSSQRQNLQQIMAMYNREAGSDVMTRESELQRTVMAEQIAANVGQLLAGSSGMALIVPPRSLSISAWISGIPVEGSKLLASLGKEGNMPLQPGDTVMVPQLQETVAVLGAVIRPGKVAYHEGAKIPQYVSMVGGEADDAVVSRAVVVRANGAAHRGRDAQEIKPGDIIIIPSDYMVRMVRTDSTFERVMKVLGSVAATFLLLN